MLLARRTSHHYCITISRVFHTSSIACFLLNLCTYPGPQMGIHVFQHNCFVVFSQFINAFRKKHTTTLLLSSLAFNHVQMYTNPRRACFPDKALPSHKCSLHSNMILCQFAYFKKIPILFSFLLPSVLFIVPIRIQDCKEVARIFMKRFK